jgi:hypothetical protein
LPRPGCSRPRSSFDGLGTDQVDAHVVDARRLRPDQRSAQHKGVVRSGLTRSRPRSSRSEVDCHVLDAGGRGANCSGSRDADPGRIAVRPAGDPVGPERTTISAEIDPIAPAAGMDRATPGHSEHLGGRGANCSGSRDVDPGRIAVRPAAQWLELLRQPGGIEPHLATASTSVAVARQLERLPPTPLPRKFRAKYARGTAGLPTMRSPDYRPPTPGADNPEARRPAFDLG